MDRLSFKKINIIEVWLHRVTFTHFKYLMNFDKCIYLWSHLHNQDRQTDTHIHIHTHTHTHTHVHIHIHTLEFYSRWFKTWMDWCNHHRHQDTKPFHHLPKFPSIAPLWLKSPQPLATTAPFSISIVSPFQHSYKWNHIVGNLLRLTYFTQY